MIMMVKMLGGKMICEIMIRKNSGTESRMSTERISNESTQPPAMPAVAPMMTPRLTATAVAMKPTASEMRAPKRAREKPSRPSSSVPKGCCQLGGCSEPVGRRSIAFGS